MVKAAIILQPGRVELHDVPDHDVPPYLRFMRPSRPLNVYTNKDSVTESIIDIQTIMVRQHQMIELSVPYAYWPESWQDAWGIEALLRWEGREGEIRRDEYYADFTVGETSHPESSNSETLVISESSSSGMKSLTAGKESG